MLIKTLTTNTANEYYYKLGLVYFVSQVCYVLVNKKLYSSCFRSCLSVIQFETPTPLFLVVWMLTVACAETGYQYMQVGYFVCPY